jgi:hypothetical protein
MSQLRRYVPFLIAGTALIAAACRDSTVAPTQSEQVASIRPLADLSYSRIVSSTEGSNASYIQFNFTRAAGSVRVGDFTLTWPENAVCDPVTSGYGWGYWDKACTAAPADIPMTVKVWKDNGQVYADFSPDIRFSPDKNVTLRVNRPGIVGRTVSWQLVAEYSIYYTYRLGDTRHYIDEAWFDYSQRSNFNTTTGDVSRRIKHFSGFVIRTGVADEIAVETGVEMP